MIYQAVSDLECELGLQNQLHWTAEGSPDRICKKSHMVEDRDIIVMILWNSNNRKWQFRRLHSATRMPRRILQTRAIVRSSSVIIRGYVQSEYNDKRRYENDAVAAVNRHYHQRRRRPVDDEQPGIKTRSCHPDGRHAMCPWHSATSEWQCSAK